MEQLIGIVLKNWYLVIIAFALFYQIRSKSRRANQETKARPEMPSFGDAPNGATRPVEAKKSDQKGLGSTLQSGRVKDDYGRPNKAKAVSTMPAQKASPFSSPTQIITESSSVYTDAISTQSPFPEQPNQDQLLQGIVWAEVLGPPRSKKPYRR
ncbi:hypothetical protein [Paenibacillus sp. Soil787]|uniref:hypothetical protein n=1 Tax=Paenibacillus sp. Soil787 TaxID=1736411 RepID=UPI0007029380|nr:hypothetical protein [Paenibacillus sp. Soil787]KRF28100.1 hypothetical protein ASG93_28995 [Paenibacillus sp. Soil787]